MKKIISSILILMQTSAFAQSPVTIPNNKLVLGKTGAADKTLEFNLTKAGATANPKIKYNNSTSKIQFSNDGSNFVDVGSGGSADNKLTNGNFETSTTGWTASGGTLSTTTTAADVFEGTTAGTFDSSSAGQTLTGTAITVGGLAGTNAELTCYVKAASAATHTLGVWDGSTLSSSQTISNGSSTGYVATTINFIVPASGTITPRFTSVAANEPLINIDDCYVGKARSIGAVAQAKLLDVVTVTGCAAQWSTSSTSYASFGTQTGCTYTSKNNICTAPSTNIPGVKCSSIPVGDYRIEYDGLIGEAVANKNAYFQFTDGTITANEESNIFATTAGVGIYIPALSQTFTYSAPKSNVTWELKGKVSASGNALVTGQTANPGVFKIWYFPTSSQQAVSSANADYDWTAYTPTFTGFGTATSIECQHSRVSSNLNIRCKFTSGTPTATEARVSLPTGLTSADTTKIPSIQIAGYGVQSVNAAYSQYVLMEPSTTYLTFSSSGAGVVGLTKLTGSSLISASGVESFTASIPIQGWSSNQRAPTLVGSVTSNSTGAIRTEYADFTCSSSSSVSSTNISTSGWMTIGNISSNRCTITFSPAFSAAPSCFPVVKATSTNTTYSAIPNVTSASSMTIGAVYNQSGVTTASTNENYSMFCFGPR